VAEPFDLLHGELDLERDRPGFRWRRARVRERLGAELIGGSLYELEAGERVGPYHFHHGAEEWALVVAGTPTLRTPDGERELRAGDVVCFPARPEGAHCLSGPGRVLLLSRQVSPDTLEYPDSGKIAAVPPGGAWRAADKVDYFEGE
jgi:uncharacterized cupin superfamily protein